MFPGFAMARIFQPDISDNTATEKDNYLVKSINYLINKSLQIGSASIKLWENRPIRYTRAGRTKL
jgi:hypothetical protein